ncbi:MBOAT family O-acyltransferase [Lachnospiraceae bacterium KK002]
MDFISVTFMIFILILICLYFLVPDKYKWMVLLAGSYVFYAFSGIKLMIFLIFTTGVTFVSGRKLGDINEESSRYLKEHKADLTRDEKKQYKSQITARKKRIVTAAVVVNLGILIFLKYFNFIAKNINLVIGQFGVTEKVPLLNLLLPLGISFYTLQSIAYIVDLYRGKYQADRNFLKFALFMSFFPQIIQGPIARYDQLASQLYEPHKFDYTRVTQGFQLVLWGYMKKLILADRLAVAVNFIFDDPAPHEGFILFFAAAGYGLQVYADFSGGMDIARGVSQVLGIELALNFERPYFAKSVEEFWRRWHITLGSWMRDYVFYPLSLSKNFANLGKRTRKIFGNYIGKKLPTFLSMFIVFLLVGVWHGSSWKYVAYGIWNGVIIVSSILLEPVYQKMAQKCGMDTESAGWKFFQMFRTFVLCSFGRFFSRGKTCMKAIDMFIRALAFPNPWVFFNGGFLNFGLSYKDYNVIFISILVLLVVGIMQERGVHIREKIAEQHICFRWVIYLGAVLTLLVFGYYGGGYSASEFIYQQF